MRAGRPCVCQHEALPEISLAEVDASARFLGFRLRAPILISSMTGGTGRAADVNLRLAEAAGTAGIAMALGSGRALIENPALATDLRCARGCARSRPLRQHRRGVAELRDRRRRRPPDGGRPARRRPLSALEPASGGAAARRRHRLPRALRQNRRSVRGARGAGHRQERRLRDRRRHGGAVARRGVVAIDVAAAGGTSLGTRRGQALGRRAPRGPRRKRSPDGVRRRPATCAICASAFPRCR